MLLQFLALESVLEHCRTGDMADATRLKLSYFFTLTAILLLIVGLATMFQTPHPEWSRGLIIPAPVLVIVGNVLRRRIRPKS